MNTKPQTMQLNMFGPPEPVGSYKRRGRGSDIPVPCERELLWPASLVQAMLQADGSDASMAAIDSATNLLERVYGDVPRRTRLRVKEVCRRLRCDNNKVYRLIENGTLPAVQDGIYLIYRSGLIAYLAWREFGPATTTRTDVAIEDAELLCRAVARMKRSGRIIDQED